MPQSKFVVFFNGVKASAATQKALESLLSTPVKQFTDCPFAAWYQPYSYTPDLAKQLASKKQVPYCVVAIEHPPGVSCQLKPEALCIWFSQATTEIPSVMIRFSKSYNGK